MSGRTVSIVAVAWIAMFSPIRAEVLLYDNEAVGGVGYWSERNTILGGEATLADDFLISDLPVSLMRIEALFRQSRESTAMAGIDVLVLEEATDGGPGDPVVELLDLTSVTQVIYPAGPPFEWINELDITLEDPLFLEPGRYYLGLRAVGPDPDRPVRYGWAGDLRLGERESYFRSEVLGYSDWAPMSEVAYPLETVFRLYGDIIPAPPAVVLLAPVAVFLARRTRTRPARTDA